MSRTVPLTTALRANINILVIEGRTVEEGLEGRSKSPIYVYAFTVLNLLYGLCSVVGMSMLIAPNSLAFAIQTLCITGRAIFVQA